MNSTKFLKKSSFCAINIKQIQWNKCYVIPWGGKQTLCKLEHIILSGFCDAESSEIVLVWPWLYEYRALKKNLMYKYMYLYLNNKYMSLYPKKYGILIIVQKIAGLVKKWKQ